MSQTELLQIAIGLAASTAEPKHLIRRPVPVEVSAYLRTRKGVCWRQLQREVAERFGLVITAGTLLRHRDSRSTLAMEDHVNTNDPTTPVAKGKSDLKPLRSYCELENRVAELEAALSAVRQWATKQHQQWLCIADLDEEDDDDEVLEALEDGWAPCCGGSQQLEEILAEVGL